MKLERRNKISCRPVSMNQFIDTVLLVFVFCLFFVFPQKIEAAFSFNIDNVIPTLVGSKDTELVVNLSVTDLPTGDNYFRVGFKEGNTYVGYIKNNNGDWIKLRPLSDGCVDYFKVNENTNSIILNLKIGSDVEISNGSIPIKAHRYTSSCASNSGSDEYLININLPTPTPSPSPTQAPATTQPTTTSTATPTPTVIATVRPTPTPIQSGQAKTSTPKPTTSPVSTVELISPTPTPTGLVAGVSTQNKSKTIAITLIFFGICFLGYCGFLIYNGKNAKGQNAS